MAVVPVDVGGSIARGLQVNQLRQQIEAQKAQKESQNALRSLYSERFGGHDPQSGITWNTGRQQAVPSAGAPNAGGQPVQLGPMAGGSPASSPAGAVQPRQTRPMMSDDEFVGRAMAIDPQAGLDWQKHFDSRSAADLEQDKAEAPLVAAALESVQDQASYDGARQWLAGRGIDVSDIPPQYNRETVNMVLQGARYLGNITGPKAPEPTQLARLYAEMNALPPGDPRRQDYLNKIKMETTRAPKDVPALGEGGPFGGTSLDAQAMNILLNPNANVSAPSYVAAYNHLAQPRLSFDPQTGRQIVITPDMSAYRRPAGAGVGAPGTVPQAPPPGQQPTATAPASAPAPGAPQPQPGAPMQGPVAGVTTQSVSPPRLSFQEAQAVGSLQGVSRELASVESLFFPNGQYDRNVAASAGDYGIVSGIPFTEGRTARQSMRRAIEVILRTRTGAAAPDSEVDSYMEQFFPSPADTDAQARAKFRAANNFVNDTYSMFGGTRDLPGLTQPPPQQGTQPAQGGRTPPPPGFVPF